MSEQRGREVSGELVVGDSATAGGQRQGEIEEGTHVDLELVVDLWPIALLLREAVHEEAEWVLGHVHEAQFQLGDVVHQHHMLPNAVGDVDPHGVSGVAECGGAIKSLCSTTIRTRTITHLTNFSTFSPCQRVKLDTSRKLKERSDQ